MKNAIIYSGSSDIGYELCLHLVSKGYNVFATYNTYSEKLFELENRGIKLFQCDLSSNNEIEESITKIFSSFRKWDLVVLLQATMNPIGKILDVDFSEWEKSIELNFTKQIKIIQSLLPFRSHGASIITFAGGGTNNAVKNYSAYTISKIALIKMMELLYAEYEDTKFTCIGPGWVDTKIHQETIAAKDLAEESYNKTLVRYKIKDFTKIETILKCIDWIISEKIEIVSGRNFSVVNDTWSTKELSEKLASDQNMYKLRREGNSWKI